MSLSRPARPAARGPRAPIVAAVAILGAAVVAGLAGCASPLGEATTSPLSYFHRLSSDAQDGDRPRRGADGSVPDDVTVFDDALPAVANLDPALLDALRRAAADAVDDGVQLFVNSGWRSPEYQERLLREAVAEYGSAVEAARWVATARTSPHVSGDAVDIGPAKARSWLSRHGAQYGLCQIYDNEPWHYELRRDAIGNSCPDRYADPTHDPRMQQ